MASNVLPATDQALPQDVLRDDTSLPGLNNPKQAGSEVRSSTPVEMDNLDSQSRPIASQSSEQPAPSTTSPPPATHPSPVIESEAVTSPAVPAATSETQSTSTVAPVNTNAASTTAPPLANQESVAISPPSDEPVTASKDTQTAPALIITLLLTTGARHPYKIDAKYLRKRNVNPTGMDPFNISVYTLKELIWRDWREEWEPRPTAPVSIRLIHFGRLLDDKSALKDCRFNTDSPNVIHMTVRPQEVVDEEDANISKQRHGRDNEGNERTPGCRCIIQ